VKIANGEICIKEEGIVEEILSETGKKFTVVAGGQQKKSSTGKKSVDLKKKKGKEKREINLGVDDLKWRANRGLILKKRLASYQYFPGK